MDPVSRVADLKVEPNGTFPCHPEEFHWEALSQLKLLQVRVGHWRWIFKADSDLLLEADEPYTTLMLLFDEQSHQCLLRVLGRTWQRSLCRDFRELYAQCDEFFSGRGACVGFEAIGGQDFPLNCRFSPKCSVTVACKQSRWSQGRNLICSGCLEAQGLVPATEIKAETELNGLSAALVTAEIETGEEIFPSDGDDIKDDEDWEEQPPTDEEYEPLHSTLRPRQPIQDDGTDSDSEESGSDRMSSKWTCHFCQKVMKSNLRYYHLKHHHFTGNFLCSLCPDLFPLAQELLDHLDIAHPDSSPTPVQCPNCAQDVPGDSSEAGIGSHYRKCIKTKQYRKRNVKSPNLGKLPDDPNSFFQCDVCGKAFKYRCTYNNHKNVHLPKRFQCDLCDYKARSKSNLQIHQRVHETGNECICPLCGKSYKHKVSLQLHIKAIHEGNEDQLPCEKCGRQFACKSSLQKHIYRAHSDMFKCVQCGYRGGGKHDLGEHMKTHEEASIVCQTCGLKVKTKRILLKHQRVHTGETPYKCHICSKAFKSSSPFYYHMKHVHKTVGKISDSKCVPITS